MAGSDRPTAACQDTSYEIVQGKVEVLIGGKILGGNSFRRCQVDNKESESLHEHSSGVEQALNKGFESTSEHWNGLHYLIRSRETELLQP